MCKNILWSGAGYTRASHYGYLRLQTHTHIRNIHCLSFSLPLKVIDICLSPSLEYCNMKPIGGNPPKFVIHTRRKWMSISILSESNQSFLPLTDYSASYCTAESMPLHYATLCPKIVYDSRRGWWKYHVPCISKWCPDAHLDELRKAMQTSSLLVF